MLSVILTATDASDFKGIYARFMETNKYALLFVVFTDDGWLVIVFGLIFHGSFINKVLII